MKIQNIITTEFDETKVFKWNEMNLFLIFFIYKPDLIV